MAQSRKEAGITTLDLKDPRLRELAGSWRWMLAFGIIITLVGFFAVFSPVVATLELALIIPIILAIVGVVQFTQALRLRKTQGAVSHFFLAGVSLIAAIILFRMPAITVLGIGIALTFYFLVSGVGKALLAFDLRPQQGWGWVLTSSVLSFAFGVYMLITFPISALWIPGLLLGIEFAFFGITTMILAMEFRRLERKQREPRESGQRRAA
jgi:uncharacterized membrane protein HdeD (DUF308 family)